MSSASQFVDDSREPSATLSSAKSLLLKTTAVRSELDDVLRRHARHWQLSRLALVDRNILRLGVWEMLYGGTPPKVAISESLKLAQEFSTGESPRFVNGVLDAVYRELMDARGGE